MAMNNCTAIKTGISSLVDEHLYDFGNASPVPISVDS